MDFSEYQKLAMRTCKWNAPCEEMLTNAALGLSGETGEVNEQVKKHLLGTHVIDKEALIGEMGDVLWYLTEMAEYLGTDLGAAAAANIAKLKKRFPGGFDGEGNR